MVDERGGWAFDEEEEEEMVSSFSFAFEVFFFL